ncbi:unnamed protein product [Rotaria sp. Silwood1]|nr:unnamed protein product [Rotaria sp. Silwood1]CAF1675948.1 unnamed protein product [Rotaria sp. Silwood1]
MFYSRTIPISIVPSLNFPTGEIPLQNLNKEQASFLWYQLLIKVLKRIPSTSVSHNDLLTKCRLEHSNNNIKLGEIQEFEDTYNSDNVIAWYTRDAFLYRLINKALKEKDIIVMYKFRFVLIDLHDRLVQLHGAYINSLKSHESTISELVVFHGQGLTLTELQNLKGNIKGRISMNSFLVASTSREIALLSAGNGSGRQVVESVFFEIHCPIMNYFTKPFAHIQQYSYSKTKDEILFSIGTVFHLAFVETLTDQLWHKALEIGENCLEFDDTAIRLVLPNIVKVFEIKHDYVTALKYMTRFLRILRKDPTVTWDDLATAYFNIGFINYCRQQRFLGIDI